jgi:hypothetical protein
MLAKGARTSAKGAKVDLKITLHVPVHYEPGALGESHWGA